MTSLLRTILFAIAGLGLGMLAFGTGLMAQSRVIDVLFLLAVAGFVISLVSEISGELSRLGHSHRKHSEGRSGSDSSQPNHADE